MKVRHIGSGTIYSSGLYNPQDARWTVVADNGEVKVFIADTCEEFKADRWKDVTEECKVHEGVSGQQYVNHSEHRFGVINYTPDYRLRKVQVWVEQPMLNDRKFIPQWAFILERKVSE